MFIDKIYTIDSVISGGLNHSNLKARFLCAQIVAAKNETFKADSKKIAAIFIEALEQNNLSNADADFALTYLGMHGDVDVLKQMYKLLTITDFKHQTSCFICMCGNENFKQLKGEIRNLDGNISEVFNSSIDQLFGWKTPESADKGLESKPLIDQIISQKGHLIHKLKAKDTTGRWAYYFVLVQPGKEDAFLKAIEGDGTVDLEDYGNVVASSYGEKPTQEVIDYLKSKYDFDV